jgi:hypothetical protein
MDPVRNPFAPGAGVQPPELTGREPLLEQARVALERVRSGRPTKSFIAVGLRGVGKTVLLNRVRQIASERHYHTIFIEIHEQKTLPQLLVPPLRRELLELDRLGKLDETIKRSLRVLKGFMSKLRVSYGGAELSLDIDPERGVADSGDLEADLPELMVALGNAARSRGVSIAILVDEIQYLAEGEMSALIMAMHRVAQTALPIVMVGAGLPQVVGQTGRSKSYAERLFDFPAVDKLDDADSFRALQTPAQAEGAEFDERALQEIAQLTQGYPYFLQEWGYHSWNVADRSRITRDHVIEATATAMLRLDQSFFRVRFDRLTPREKDYLRAMAALGPGPHRSGDIAETLGIRVQSAGPLRSGLIAKGMVYSPAHGDTAFTVPLFDQFLRRIMPDLPERR